MVVGESGLGKSTLINSLFLEDLYKNRKIPDVSERIQKTTTIEKKTMEIEERGVKLRCVAIFRAIKINLGRDFAGKMPVKEGRFNTLTP